MTGRFTTLIVLVAVLALGGRATVAVAQSPEWQFGYQSATPIRVPGWLRADSLRSALSYDGDSSEAIAGFLADLNRDGIQDYVFRFSRAVCGTNCEYALVDGRTHRTLGKLGGTVVIVRPQVINGYPVIQTYGHSSVDSGYWSTAVFDGSAYVAVASVYVEGISQTRLFDSLKDIRSWPVPATSR
jgi:hypothetical protein